METTASAASTLSENSPWLYDRRWDLTFITLSVVLVSAPYLSYLGLMRLQEHLRPVAALFGASVPSFSRNIVNASIALLVGGPHLFATFSRTALDHDFARAHSKLLWSSLLIPAVVITLAAFNLTLLLTIFFFWASIHVLHQILFITELYNRRGASHLTPFSRLADYAVILTALYPLAAWKVSIGQFKIGQNDIGALVARVVPVGPWLVWAAGGAFGISLALWIAKSVGEWRAGALHGPKTLFIALTVLASFFVPALGNLDTAFQGMNVWHSLQYLALTWMLNHLRLQRGELDRSPFVKRLSSDGSARRYYLFQMGLTGANILLMGVLLVVLRFGFGKSFDSAFDHAYYVSVLSFLWIHYYHDHFLFARPQALAP